VARDRDSELVRPDPAYGFSGSRSNAQKRGRHIPGKADLEATEVLSGDLDQAQLLQRGDAVVESDFLKNPAVLHL
jgi:hypothetical protein